jgi:hypothetical protein
MRVLAAVILMLITVPVLGRDEVGSEIVRGLCQKDGCDEFSVVRVERIRADEEGTLFQTRIRTFHASSQGRVERGEDTGFVFCSPTKPTILAQSQGKVAGFQIATAPTQESRETIRQQANYYAMYFTICHGPQAGRAAVQNLEGVAQHHGYRSPLAKSVMVHFSSPEEVFSRPLRQAGREEAGRAVSATPQTDLHAPHPLPPRAVPELREHPQREERWVERRWDDRKAERRLPEDDDEIVIFRERRRVPEERPWYREPERWVESINPF